MNKKLKKILIVLIVILAVYFILKIAVVRHIIKLLLISFVISYALKPLKRKLVSLGLNKKLATIVIILGSTSLLAAMFIILIPNIIKDGMILNNTFQHIKRFVDEIYMRLEAINKNETMRTIVSSLYAKINVSMTEFFNNAFDKIMNLGGNLLSYIVIPVIVYYFLSENDELLYNVLVFVPVRSRKVIKKIGRDIDKILGRYIVSQFLLCFLISILTFLVLIVFKVNYPILLALLNGILNIIPYFGPLFGSVPAVLMALVQSPQMALWVTISLYAIQQIEGDIISPKVTGDSISMHPLIVLLLLIIGGKLGGFVGMVLAVPVGVIIKVIYDDLNYYLF